MFCPICNTQNLATDVRCLKCRALLIETSESRSKDYKKSAEYIDGRIYSGIGSFIGVGFALLSIKVLLSGIYLNDTQMFWTMIIAAIVGALLGRYIAYKKWNE
jgi:VIT1/CCC1 family predicted Fe2+/Mn2+ transporter